MRSGRYRRATEAAGARYLAVAESDGTRQTAGLTAVQTLDRDDLCARLLHGSPDTVVAGLRGPIALFAPGRLVVFLLETPVRTKLFVFRTRLRGGTSTVPGVFPAVDLLVETKTRTSAAKIRNLLLWLPKTKHDPNDLSDAFWLRVGGLVAGRRGRRPSLPALLAREG